MRERVGALRNYMREVAKRPNHRDVLRQCEVLSSLSDEDFGLLEQNSYLAYAERGEVIWLSGATAEFIAIIGSGFVKLTKTSPHGHEVTVELLGPSQPAGIMAAIESHIYPLSALAVSNCWYLKIPTPLFLNVYEHNEKLKDMILKTLGPRLRRAYDMMTRLSSGKVEERVAAVLLILATSYGKPAETGTVLEVPLTRQDIAEMAGTTVETTIRVMSRWQKNGVLTTDHQVITLHCLQSLNDTLG
ncbi:MAG: hypothetical protein AKCLJLPJ_02432 [Fimbriimonadales bacterium]|nr:hypothetical protein [Fimbriimonadales bacterium]